MYARLINYPDKDIYSLSDDCVILLEEYYPEDSENVLKFCSELKKMSLDKLEELYVGTFDVNPICALEVGWQIWGEQYKRGEFLTEMRVHLREYGISEQTELPDHLIHMLPLLSKMNADVSLEYCSKYVLPAVKKMIEGFKDNDHLYYLLLSGILLTLSSQCEKNIEDAQHV